MAGATMTEFPLSTDTQHLRNMIEDAESDTGITVLRSVLRSAADKAPAADVLRMAKALLQRRIEDERGEWARRN
jgi:hypothetical protein